MTLMCQTSPCQIGWWSNCSTDYIWMLVKCGFLEFFIKKRKRFLCCRQLTSHFLLFLKAKRFPFKVGHSRTKFGSDPWRGCWFTASKKTVIILFSKRYPLSRFFPFLETRTLFSKYLRVPTYQDFLKLVSTFFTIFKRKIYFFVISNEVHWKEI